MAKFSAEKYKKELAEATSIEELGKKLLPKLKKDQNYVFISYSHRDYKKVYQDLADLRESGVPFWFDEGLPAGESWIKSVRQRLGDPRCRGVIFYLSDNLFLSTSLQVEINMVCGRDSEPETSLRRLDYFSVNLTKRLPSVILQKVIGKKSFADAHNPMGSIKEWTDTLAEAFSDDDKYLPFSSCTHKDELIREIGSKFNIYANYNPYDFGDAKFVCGSGTIEFENGSRYEGDYCGGMFEGHGKMAYSSGAVYEGTWKAGRHHGEGAITYSDGAIYSGGWENGMRHGEGTYKDSEIQYAGHWERDLPNGTGDCTYPDGTTYSGQWKDGMSNGEGTYHWPDESKYTGQWKNGKCHGKGVMRNSEGDIYDGDWKNGIPEGQCTVIRHDGHRYVGGWGPNGSKGQGTQYYPDGASRSGTWDGDTLIRGQGVIRYDDGSWYDGEIRNNLRHGQGVYTLADGTVQRGTFRDDVFVDA